VNFVSFLKKREKRGEKKTNYQLDIKRCPIILKVGSNLIHTVIKPPNAVLTNLF